VIFKKEKRNVTHIVLRQFVVELHPKVNLGEMFVKLEGFAKGGELLAESTLWHGRVQRTDLGRHDGRNGGRFAFPAMPLQPILQI